MSPLARSALTLGRHFLRALPGGIDRTEGRQLLADALVIGAALSTYAPASVAPVLAGALGWAGTAVVSPPVSADVALADLLDAVEASIVGASGPLVSGETPVAGTPRVQPPEIVVIEAIPVTESAPLTPPAEG